MRKTLNIQNIILKENQTINEDLASHDALESLSNAILVEYIRLFVKRAFELKSEPVMYSNLFEELEPQKFGPLAEFVKNFHLYLRFDNIAGSGGRFSAFDDRAGTINVSAESKYVWNIFLDNYDADASEAEIAKDMYYTIYSDSLISTLIHELQHAYDYYRSKGKYVKDKKSQEYYDKENQFKAYPKTDKRTDTEKEATHTQYLKLQHEINARFSQAVKKTTAHNFDLETRRTNKFIPLKDYLSSFQINFYGWDKMTDKVKRVLLRRASKIYNETLEKFQQGK